MTASGPLTRLLTAAFGVKGRRVERRRHVRAPVEVAGMMDDVVVWVVDLTTAGVGLVSPCPVELGEHVDLVAGLPMMDGHTQATRLRLTVTGCRPDLEGDRGFRIGGTVAPRADLDRIALVEYCHVAARSYLNEVLSRNRARIGQPAQPLSA